MTSRHSKVMEYVGARRSALKKCGACDVEFEWMQEIYTKRMSGNKKKRYCLPCATKLNIYEC